MNILSKLLPTRSKKDLIILFSILIYLFVLCLTIQLPSFFIINDSPDESTFILMGQSILDGHLPYTELWDIKPPLAFLFFAIAIAIGGKSIIAIRLFGSICIVLAAFCIYLIGKNIWNYKVGILGSTLLTIIVALGTDLGTIIGAVNVEQIVIVPLSASLAVTTLKKIEPKACFSTGLLMGIAAMIRLNLAYVVLILGFFIIIILFRQQPLSINKIIKCGFAYTLGCSIVIFITYFPYLITNHQQLWWRSVIEAPLSYSNSSLSIVGAFGAQLRYLRDAIFQLSSIGINILVWLGGIGGLITLFLQWKLLSKAQKTCTVFTVVFLIATELSILKGGKAYGHYYIQLYPFLSLASAVFLHSILYKFTRWLTIIVLLLSLSGAIPLMISMYKPFLTRVLSDEPLFNGVCYESVSYIKNEGYLNEPIFFLNCHIGYWLLNSKPLTKSTTQPYNIINSSLLPYMGDFSASTESELVKVLSQKPKYIVAKGGFSGNPGKLFAKALERDYSFVKLIQKIGIYKRKN